MSNAIEFTNVWKKFKKGEKFNSLRDSIPNFFRKAVKPAEGTLADREFWAVKDVSFEIKKGEIVGILGPNGAGKSTILKLLSRIMNPTHGSMQINGRLSALIEVTAGFHPELTGRENVYLNGTILGMSKKEIDARFEEIVEFSGVTEFIDTPVKRYSSGMYSRLGFSVAAHIDPEVLLVDEVLSVGDVAFQSRCAQKMRELFARGVTIILVSHNLSLVQSLCKRVILLNHGQMVQDDVPEKVIPYYENLIYSDQERRAREKLSSADETRVKINDKSPAQITSVRISNKAGRAEGPFLIGDDLVIDIEYASQRPIPDPIISLEIMRADGVLCCSANTKDSQFAIEDLRGKGKLRVNLGKNILANGIYYPVVTIWDKDMIHSYAIHKQALLRIESQGLRQMGQGVFKPDFGWERV